MRLLTITGIVILLGNYHPSDIYFHKPQRKR